MVKVPDHKVLKEAFERQKAKATPRKDPLWKGPEEDGITFSLLSRFLVCRERFRLLVVEGFAPADGFNHRMEYGNFWHLCEEELARGGPPNWFSPTAASAFFDPLLRYSRSLAAKYPTQQIEIDKWYNVCKVEFPIYQRYWESSPDVVERTPLLQESSFSVPYRLPSGRTVRLRGKWDSVDLIRGGCDCGADRTGPSAEAHSVKCASQRSVVYLQENKTKGDIREQQIKRQLKFDLQTMLYLVAFRTWQDLDDYGEPVRTPQAVETPVAGVRYNVIRRPLSGGKGSIIQHKPTKSKPEGETKGEYYNRLSDIISEVPQDFFMRWTVEITPADIERFRRECLDPILEQLWDWWNWVKHLSMDPFKPGTPQGIKDGVVHGGYGIHWRHPYGVYNVLDEGGSSELDEYLDTGSLVGLDRVSTLFPELT